MPRGRPSNNVDDDEKLAIRREKVRLNVQAHRQRQKLKKLQEALNEPSQPEFRWIQETKWQASSDKTLPEQKALALCKPSHDAECTLLYEPTPEKQYSYSLMGMFRTRFLPQRLVLPGPRLSEHRLVTPCALWVVRGYDTAAFREDPLVGGIVRALGLAILGVEHQREDILSVSTHRYYKTLAAISRQLRSLNNGESLDVNDHLALVLACHAVSIFELSASGSLTKMFTHVRGLGSLLLRQSLQLETVPEEWYDFMEEYELMELTLCLIYRQSPVLTGAKLGKAVRRRYHAVGELTTPRSMTGQLQELVHICRPLLPIMEYVDDADLLSNPNLERLKQSLDSISHITTGMQQWAHKFLARDASQVVGSEAYTSGHGELDFPGLEVAAAWLFWLCFKAHTLETHISVIEQIQSHQQKNVRSDDANQSHDSQPSNLDTELTLVRSELLDTLHLLMRSTPYFLKANIGLIGQSFVCFPLETARVAFLHELHRETSPSSSDTESVLSTEKMKSLLQGLKACKRLAEKASDMRCALFTDPSGEWSPPLKALPG